MRKKGKIENGVEWRVGEQEKKSSCIMCRYKFSVMNVIILYRHNVPINIIYKKMKKNPCYIKQSGANAKIRH